MLYTRVCLVVLGIYGLSMVVCCRGHLNPSTTSDVVKSRQKRIVFPINGAIGIVAALAIPLIVPSRNVYMSYNFEANYNSPADAHIYTEGFANFLKGVVEPLTAPPRPIEDYGIRKRSTAEKVNRKTPTTAQITRRQLYKMLRKQLQGLHFHGKRCLQRMICEAALHPFAETNGLTGDLMQILLSPSTSVDENLPKEYLLAEVSGSNGSCDQYRAACPKDPLDRVSLMIQ